jgi:hypothetical protein
LVSQASKKILRNCKPTNVAGIVSLWIPTAV